MGAGKSILEEKGYILQKENEYTKLSIPNDAVVATKGADTFLIRVVSKERSYQSYSNVNNNLCSDYQKC